MGSYRTRDLLATFTKLVPDQIDTRIRRRRVWCGRSIFVAVMLLTRRGASGGYRMLMRRFMEDTARLLGWCDNASAASLSRARKLLPVESCRQVLHQLVERISACTPRAFLHWSKRRFIAIDGTKFIMPRTRQTLAKFDRPGSSWIQAHHPQAVTVVAADLLKRLPLDWVLLPKKRGERDGALQLLKHFRPGDVAVLDRGYPSRPFLAELLKRQIAVVMRLPATLSGSWREVHDFMRSGEKERVCDVELPGGARAKVRLIRNNFRVGRPRKHQVAKPMVVMTTLMADEGFTEKEIVQLYQARWGVETLLREIKVGFDVERFHARSLVGVEQEIAAVLVWIALGSALQIAAEDGLPEGRRVYRTLCHAWASEVLAAWFKGGNALAEFEKALPALRADHYLPRPNRSYPRERKRPFGRFRNGSH